ncbi:Phosphate uptake regulator [Halogranum rubrum]|uniref:Phosphate uptake regulator n=1 Tax=Halogranum rubrum TaxID=553466 RepID=A0A1I4B4L6_9EURY|nr:phosphate uptake regulator PhoU [Halogranum rubrum]SFK62816.1 Phosphate uptake regulator [Halogranum rubrum]
MERRKVQQTGSSTYTISLPKQWASRHGIEPGMSLALCPVEDGSLVIGANQTADGGTQTVDLTGKSAADVRRTVERCYAFGFDHVRFVADDLTTEQRRAITTAANSRTGLQVVDETDSVVTVDCLLDATEMSLDRSVVQLQYVALSMQTDATTALTTGDDELAAHVIDRQRDVERRAAVVERYFERALTDHEVLNALGLTRPRLFDYRVAATRLGRVATEAATVADVARRLDSAPNEWLASTTALARRTRSHVEDAVAVLLDGVDSGQASVLEATGTDLRDELAVFDRTLYEQGGSDAAEFGRLVESLRQIVDHGDAIAARAGAAALRQPTPVKK